MNDLCSDTWLRTRNQKFPLPFLGSHSHPVPLAWGMKAEAPDLRTDQGTQPAVAFAWLTLPQSRLGITEPVNPSSGAGGGGGLSRAQSDIPDQGLGVCCGH